jgi:hypothetical protein
VNDPAWERFETDAATLLASHGAWCAVNNLRPMSAQAFSRALEERGITKKRTARLRMYVGIALVGEAEGTAARHLRAVETSGAVAFRGH